MEGVTLAVAVLAVIGVLAFPTRYSVPIYIGALAWYPSYLAVSIGTVNFTVNRMVILALLARLLLGRASTGGFRWGWVDTFVVVALVGECVAGLMTTPAAQLLQNRAGAAFDTVLPYFAVRLAIRAREDYKALLWSVLVISIPLAVFGAYECWTGDNPLGFLRRYAFAGPSLSDRELPGRRGFWRAEVTFPISIMFGLFFAMMGPMCAVLWGYTKRKGLLLAGLTLMLVGVLSSMSSGPLLAGIATCSFMALYPFRRHWKLITVLLVIWLGAIDTGSNRHWYDVLGSYCTLDAATAWYRIRLMEVALGGGMSGHWLAGFGLDVDPGWGRLIDGRMYTDVVNHYVVILVRGGLLGLLPFLGAVGGSLLALRRAYARATEGAERWLLWGILSSLAGILAAMFSVSLMGQILTLFFLLLALCVNAGTHAFSCCRAATDTRCRPMGNSVRTGAAEGGCGYCSSSGPYDA
jgi:hypothetical protein